MLYIDETPVYASMSGLLRGLIQDGYNVTSGFKMADIDPRVDGYQNCFTISDQGTLYWWRRFGGDTAWFILIKLRLAFLN